MINHDGINNIDLLMAENGIRNCENYSNCKRGVESTLNLSDIPPGAERRGSRDPQVLIITEAPDENSSEGTPYSGSLSTRIVNLFCDDRYGISLPEPEDNSFLKFLHYNRFYATSAVKCQVKNGGSALSDYVISKCHERFLRHQIEAMPNLELIVPMGRIAASSITQHSVSSIQITTLIGRYNEGIFPNHREYNVPIAILPHPSGINPFANPPIIKPSDDRHGQEYKIHYREALSFIRQTLGNLGYDVLEKSPSLWDSPPGLSEYR